MRAEGELGMCCSRNCEEEDAEKEGHGDAGFLSSTDPLAEIFMLLLLLRENLMGPDSCAHIFSQEREGG